MGCSGGQGCRFPLLDCLMPVFPGLEAQIGQAPPATILGRTLGDGVFMQASSPGLGDPGSTWVWAAEVDGGWKKDPCLVVGSFGHPWNEQAPSLESGRRFCWGTCLPPPFLASPSPQARGLRGVGGGKFSHPSGKAWPSDPRPPWKAAGRCKLLQEQLCLPHIGFHRFVYPTPLPSPSRPKRVADSCPSWSLPILDHAH